MKKTVLLASLLGFVATAAIAQSAPPPSTAKFTERKAEVVARIQDRIAKEQAVLTCVQAAQDHKALRACMPKRR